MCTGVSNTDVVHSLMVFNSAEALLPGKFPSFFQRTEDATYWSQRAHHEGHLRKFLNSSMLLHMGKVCMWRGKVSALRGVMFAQQVQPIMKNQHGVVASFLASSHMCELKPMQHLPTLIRSFILVLQKCAISRYLT